MREPSATALVELSTAHLELMYSQVLFLNRAGVEVHVILPDTMRELSTHLGDLASMHFIRVPGGNRGRWVAAANLRHCLLDLRVRNVVFNTAEGNYVRDFLSYAPLGITYNGILHHADKLRYSFTQFLISRRVRRYAVMNDYLLAHVPRRARKRVTSVYPIFFPIDDASDVQKPAGEFWACIPGTVEFPRRDYVGLLEAMRTHPVDPSVRFIVLGSTRGFNSDGPELEARVKRAGLENRFVFFREFVPRQRFFGYLRRCDIILPLTNPGVSNYEYYRSSGISGAFNLAFGVRKPMLLDTSWTHLDDFRQTSVFHEPGKIVQALNAVAGDSALLAAREAEARSYQKFTFPHQQERFLEFLFG